MLGGELAGAVQQRVLLLLLDRLSFRLIEEVVVGGRTVGGEALVCPELDQPLDLLVGDVDALDAAGFSSALPGVIHYDVFRDDPRMHSLLTQYMGDHGIARFIDGGLVDNLPARAAWRAVHKGEIGTRSMASR